MGLPSGEPRRPDKGAPIRFCETNPPFFEGIFDGSDYEYVCCEGNMREKSVGSFWKTNPPERVFDGFGYRGSNFFGGLSGSVGSVHTSALRPSGVGTTRCRLGATLAPRHSEGEPNIGARGRGYRWHSARTIF